VRAGGSAGAAPLTLIVPTTDGALYFIRPDSQCVDRLDVGGRVYAHPARRFLETVSV